MSAGIMNIMAIGKLAKHGAIAILQAVAKDGFQGTDLFAPLNSQQFQAALQPVIANYKEVLKELADLGPMEILSLGQAAYVGWMDIKTELDLALAKVNALKAK